MSTPDEFTADDDVAVEDSDEELELDDELALDEDEDGLALDDSEDVELAIDDELTPIDDLAADEDTEDDTGEEAEVATPIAVVAEEEEEEEGPDLDEETEDVVEDADAEGEESLDVLLSRAKVSDDDLGRLEEPRDGFTVPAQPISPNEFTCRSCFLVKNRAQLADEEKLFCLDCA